MDANPEAHEHAQLRYASANLRFVRDLVEAYSEPADAVVFLQTIEHLSDPRAALEHFRALVGASAARVFVSTPNVLTLAPKGAPRSDNPWHVREYRAGEFERAVPRAASPQVRAVRPLPRAQAARPRDRPATRLGRLHPRLVSRERFYGWFTPAIAASDFRLLRGARRAARSRARLPRRVPAVSVRRESGALAIVLHTHMPYVEGFGTWPFGEEWLWEAMASCYLPLLDMLDARLRR